MPLQVDSLKPGELSIILSEPLKEFPPEVQAVLPKANLKGFPVPALFRDSNSHLVILAGIGEKYAACVPFDSSGLRMVRLPHNQFGYAFEHMANEPVERAIAMFARNAPVFGATEEVQQFLTAASTQQKESSMKLGSVLIIAAKVAEVFNSKKLGDEALEKLTGKKKENAVLVMSAEDLTQFTVAELTGVYNSVAAKAVKKLSDKSAETCARVWKAIDDKFAGQKGTEPPAAATVDADKKADKKGGKSDAAPAVRKVKGAASATEKADGPRPESKMGKLLARLRKSPATVEQLVTASGFDDKNVKTAIGILRSGRTAGNKKFTVTLDDGKYTLAE